MLDGFWSSRIPRAPYKVEFFKFPSFIYNKGLRESHIINPLATPKFSITKNQKHSSILRFISNDVKLLRITNLTKITPFFTNKVINPNLLLKKKKKKKNQQSKHSPLFLKFSIFLTHNWKIHQNQSFQIVHGWWLKRQWKKDMFACPLSIVFFTRDLEIFVPIEYVCRIKLFNLIYQSWLPNFPSSLFGWSCTKVSL